MPGKWKARTIKQFGNIAGWIDADQKEWDLFQTRPLQGRDAMGGLLEAGAELARQRFQIVATRLGGFRERRIWHDKRRSGVARECPACQQLGALGGEMTGFECRTDLIFHVEVGELLGQLEIEACGIERVLQQQLLAMESPAVLTEPSITSGGK